MSILHNPSRRQILLFAASVLALSSTSARALEFEDGLDQAEWQQSYDAVSDQLSTRSATPLLSAGTLSATEATIVG